MKRFADSSHYSCVVERTTSEGRPEFEEGSVRSTRAEPGGAAHGFHLCEVANSFPALYSFTVREIYCFQLDNRNECPYKLLLLSSGDETGWTDRCHSVATLCLRRAVGQETHVLFHSSPLQAGRFRKSRRDLTQPIVFINSVGTCAAFFGLRPKQQQQ